MKVFQRDFVQHIDKVVIGTAKDPNLPDTLYVTELAVQGVVNTMPEKTMEATFDHAPLHGDGFDPS